jgi:hypothetical protein
MKVEVLSFCLLVGTVLAQKNDNLIVKDKEDLKGKFFPLCIWGESYALFISLLK